MVEQNFLVAFPTRAGDDELPAFTPHLIPRIEQFDESLLFTKTPEEKDRLHGRLRPLSKIRQMHPQRRNHNRRTPLPEQLLYCIFLCPARAVNRRSTPN